MGTATTRVCPSGPTVMPRDAEFAVFDAGALDGFKGFVGAAAGIGIHGIKLVIAGAVAIALAFADDQQATHGGQADDVFTALYGDGVDQFEGQQVDFVNDTAACHVSAA